MASGEEASKKFEEEEAIKYLRLDNKIKDTTFGINKIDGHHYIGDTHVIIHKNNIIVDDEKFNGTPGLWNLIMLKEPKIYFTNEDLDNYVRLMVKTHVLHQGNNPNSSYPKSSRSNKWLSILGDIWKNRKKYEGKGISSMLMGILGQAFYPHFSPSDHFFPARTTFKKLFFNS